MNRLNQAERQKIYRIKKLWNDIKDDKIIIYEYMKHLQDDIFELVAEINGSNIPQFEGLKGKNSNKMYKLGEYKSINEESEIQQYTDAVFDILENEFEIYPHNKNNILGGRKKPTKKIAKKTVKKTVKKATKKTVKKTAKKH